MSGRKAKKVSESRTEQVQIVMLSHINGAHRLFGGVLVEWIDVLAAVVARRHSNSAVTTLSIDHLTFKKPVYANETVILCGQVTYVGRTSMEVRVDTFVEKLDGERTLVNRAYLVMVAIDENGKSVEVPELIAETEEEKQEQAAGRLRSEQRKQNAANNM